MTEKESHEVFRKAYNKVTSNRIINRRALSLKLTGSPNRIRNDFTPKKFIPIITELEYSVNRILKNYGYGETKPTKD